MPYEASTLAISTMPSLRPPTGFVLLSSWRPSRSWDATCALLLQARSFPGWRFAYEFLERDARLVDIGGAGQLKRTAISTPRKNSQTILQELLGQFHEFVIANKLTYHAGKHLAGVLAGKTDGIRVIFGSIEGRELVQALYCEQYL
ncbi:uncharacterized protein BDW70DRAFT_144107 [Aspergillus foveolatus]|uniref:uncharacterized protein n=1 Tax=Aspergillus foveolatus TaxID=210207 RepID=UPI003CCD40CA